MDEALLLLKAFEASSQGWFWAVDTEGQLTYLSHSVGELLGGRSETLLGSAMSDLFVLSDNDLTGRRTLPFMLTRRLPFDKVTLRPSDTSVARQWAVSGVPQFTEAGEFTGYRGSAIDITEHRRSSEDASRLAEYDALTGLPNRRRMSELLEAHLRETTQLDRSCAVMLVDLDRFKQVNDTLGHPAGDALLKQVAARLVRIVGDRERVFRLGGDEFQVILPNPGDEAEIKLLASSIISSLSDPYSLEGSRCTIGASIGIAVAPGHGRSQLELIRNADLALYGSKSEGRGRYRFFSEDLLQAAEDRRALEEDLRDALARDQISLAYQPVVDAGSNQITGVEALLRWNHPVKGPISPAVFIPIAEEAGLVGQLGDWALRQACDDAAGWPGTLRVAVNVSPAQFNDGSLPKTVVSALAASGLSAERLELEITEGVFLGDTPAADAMFVALKRVGVRLALDDFGTGYSSLGYLRNAPFDKIKIDQSFVREATLPGSRNAAIIAAIVALAEALGMDTTAEGIEYMDQLALIRSLRVSHVQGWVYSKALSSGELHQRLSDGKWAIEPSGPSTQRSSRLSVYRKIGVIHASRYRSAVVRNLSVTGALIEQMDLPVQTMIVVDFGEGQLTLARVVRSSGRGLGIEFEQELVDDEIGGLKVARRVSPYQIATVGLPSPGDPDRMLSVDGTPLTVEQLAQRFGLSMATEPQRPAEPVKTLHWSSAEEASPPTFKDLSQRYLDSLAEDEQAREAAERDLCEHMLPAFGHLQLAEVNPANVREWLTALGKKDSVAAGEDGHRLKKLLARMWSLAIDLHLADADANPVDLELGFNWREEEGAMLSATNVRALLQAAGGSANRQLRFIIALLMLTSARTRDILNMQWSQIDFGTCTWQVRLPGSAGSRDIALNDVAIRLVKSLPRLDGCAYILPNPTTRKPYRTLTQSWEMVKSKAGLIHLELEDLRYCRLSPSVWRNQLEAVLQQQDGEESAAAG